MNLRPAGAQARDLLNLQSLGHALKSKGPPEASSAETRVHTDDLQMGQVAEENPGEPFLPHPPTWQFNLQELD